MWATVINDGYLGKDDTLAESEKETIYENKLKVLEAFWRATGFRRIGTSPYFCLARSQKHPSCSLAAGQDYQRPAALSFSPRIEGAAMPIIQETDAGTLRLLKEPAQKHVLTDPVWLQADRHGHNAMHQGSSMQPTRITGVAS